MEKLFYNDAQRPHLLHQRRPETPPPSTVWILRKKSKIVVDFSKNSDILNPVMRDKKTFLNATFKVEKNPTYTGNHFMARVNNVKGCTFPLGTTEQEMIDQYHDKVVLEKDIDGNKVLAGDIHRVVEVSFYEDSIADNDLRITHD